MKAIHMMWRRWASRLGAFGVLLMGLAAFAQPADLPASGYSVTLDGRATKVESMRCSAMPVNIRWPGHQREKDQTEICGFARFDFVRPVAVSVIPPRAFTNVLVRPLAKKVVVRRQGNAVEFTIREAGAYSVEFDGRHENLFIFADVAARYGEADRHGPNVRYFGPGEHEAGVITLKTGETLFLDEGAVVYGRVVGRDSKGIRILGRGILDASHVKEDPIAIDPKEAEAQRKKGWAIKNVKRWNTVDLHFCDDAVIEGITIRDSQIYAVRPVCCDNLRIENVKVVGSWRYNSDGIDMHNCRNVTIRNCFIRTYDDSICVKGFDYCLPMSEMTHQGVVHDLFENVLVEKCTIWNDWGRALEIGAETRAKEIRNITFRDCDILSVDCVALDVQNCDQAHVHDITFENIRVEYPEMQVASVYSASAKDFDPKKTRAPASLVGAVICYIPEYSKAGAANRGRTDRITFRNIDVTGPVLPGGFLRGFDADHRVSEVSVEGIRFNGRDATDEFRTRVAVNQWASWVGDIRSYGAATNALPRTNAAAFQAAIDRASAAGGGRVVVPAGTWTSGTIWLKSNVELHLEKGAVLKASADHADYNAEDAYPENFGCPKTESWRGLHFIICRGAENVAITGEGTIHGNGDAFFEKKPPIYYPDRIAWWNGILWSKNKKLLRPGQLIVFIKCRRVKVTGITIFNSPCWSLFCHGCEDVVVRDYTVRNGFRDANTDGVDVDCCRNVLLENLDVLTGDDGVAIRASGRHLGMNPQPPCENIVLRHARLDSSSSVIRIGVGEGVIRNVLIEDVESRRGGTAINLNACYGDVKLGGVDMENIVVRHCRFLNCRQTCNIHAAGEKQTFGIRNVIFDDVTFPYGVPHHIGANAGSPEPQNILFMHEKQALSADGESTLTAWLPKEPGKAHAGIVICPGGGYRVLCDTYEGDDMARWLTARGIAAFVLRYRLAPKYHKDEMLADVHQALNCVRAQAKTWNVDPHRVGVLGFSAGGHLAAMAGLLPDKNRADFMALVYPHISMTRGLGHEHMRKSFLGPDYSDADVVRYSGEQLVTDETPPAFVAHAKTDKVCAVDHSRRFVAAMQAKGRSVAYAELPRGDHGLGCGKGEDWAAWLQAFENWLKSQGLM